MMAVGFVAGVASFLILFGLAKRYTDMDILCNFKRCYYDPKLFLCLAIAPLVVMVTLEMLRRAESRPTKKPAWLPTEAQGQEKATGTGISEWAARHAFVFGFALSTLFILNHAKPGLLY
jgi:hypothetical protein